MDGRRTGKLHIDATNRPQSPSGLRPVFYRAGARMDPGRCAVGVYLDVVFALNGAVNYLLLCASGRLYGAMPRRSRLLAAALL
ncbi:MAG: sigma-E processing peptidase SpoIIGA, partial [Oscillospiraceae bacterium]|nr:sigma-E processing peptidase SpoIIGA [Oscillospiraceae bacterium]